MNKMSKDADLRKELHEVELMREDLENEKEDLLLGKTRFKTDKEITKRKRELDNRIKELNYKEDEIIHHYKGKKQDDDVLFRGTRKNPIIVDDDIVETKKPLFQHIEKKKPLLPFTITSVTETKYPASALLFSFFMLVVGIVLVYVGWENNTKIKDCQSVAMKNANNLLMCMGAFIVAVVLAYFVFTRNSGALNPSFGNRGYYLMSLLIGITIFVLSIIIMTEAKSQSGCDVGNFPVISLVLSIVMIGGSSYLLYSTPQQRI